MHTTTSDQQPAKTNSRPYPDTNSVILVGKVASGPTLKHVGENNTALATLDIHVNNPRSEPTIIRVQIWARGAEAVHKYTSPGDQIIVNGRLQTNTYQNQVTTYIDAGTTGIQFTANRQRGLPLV